MIKLTALHYKVKESALERFHNINSHNESLIFKWEKEVETAANRDLDFPEKPFVEPFEFEDSDYNITEKKFRIRKEDIFSYMENEEGRTELTTTNNTEYTIAESIAELDELLKL